MRLDRRWGVSAAVAVSLLLPVAGVAAPASASVGVAEPPSVEVVGDTQIPIGSAVNIQLTPTQPNTVVIMPGTLPAGLTWDGNTNRIAGTAPFTSNDHLVLVTVINTKTGESALKLFMLDFTGRIDGDTYTEVIFDHAVKASDSERWVANCPAEFPFLDKTVESTGRTTGKGILVWEESWGVTVVTDVERTAKLNRSNGIAYVTGNSGSITNWRLAGQYLRIDMVCTRDLQRAWEEPLQGDREYQVL